MKKAVTPLIILTFMQVGCCAAQQMKNQSFALKNYPNITIVTKDGAKESKCRVKSTIRITIEEMLKGYPSLAEERAYHKALRKTAVIIEVYPNSPKLECKAGGRFGCNGLFFPATKKIQYCQYKIAAYNSLAHELIHFFLNSFTKSPDKEHKISIIWDDHGKNFGTIEKNIELRLLKEHIHGKI